MLLITNNYLEKLKTLFKPGNEFSTECPIDLDENLAFEETLYK